MLSRIDGPQYLNQDWKGAPKVIAEGLGGRTTCFDDLSAAAERNGARILPTVLGTHYPLALIVIMLGTNDLKPYLSGTALGAAGGMGRLVEIVRTYPYGWGATAPRVLIVAPPHCCGTTSGDRSPAAARSIAESQQLAPAYRRLAEQAGCAFFDAATVAVASPFDGVHLDAANTRAIGRGLIPVVSALLDTLQA